LWDIIPEKKKSKKNHQSRLEATLSVIEMAKEFMEWPIRLSQD